MNQPNRGDVVESNWPMLISALVGSTNAAIFTHQRPDPDAIGSQVGLARLLSAAGKSGAVVEFPPVPGSLEFLLKHSPWPLVEYTEAWAREHLPNYDAIIVVDTSSSEQLGTLANVLRDMPEKLICIDHHLSGDVQGRCMFRDSQAGSCAELIVQLAGQLGVMDKAAATVLLAGITSDTGWFHYEGTSAGTLRAAAECVQAGALPVELWNRLMERDSVAKLKLTGLALEKCRFELSNQVAIIELSVSDFAQTKAQNWETEGLINIPMAIADVLVSLCLTEQPDGDLRISLRSKHTVNVAAVAAEFGGGGHARAAGCRMKGSLQDAAGRLVAAIAAHLNTAK